MGSKLLVDPELLASFVVAAKRATYVGDGERAQPSRLGSHDLTFVQGPFAYRDSYFGGTDFLGQELVWYADQPVWAMSYHGYILRPELIDAARAEGRFLGGFEWRGPHGVYRDSSTGDVTHFRGREAISVGGVEAYTLDYLGGLIKP
jgi:hypothetical protein